MGELEKQSRKRRQRRNIKKLVLQSVALAGGLTIATLAPNVLGAMGRLHVLPARREEEIIKSSRRRLVKQGFLTYEGTMLQLTPKGRQALKILELKEYGLKKPRRWDGRWRVLIFDIPERRRFLRARIRGILSRIGFVRLQDSVWLYPYDCEDVVTLLKADMKIGKDLLYLIVDSLENDAWYRRHFELK